MEYDMGITKFIAESNQIQIISDGGFDITLKLKENFAFNKCLDEEYIIDVESVKFNKYATDKYEYVGFSQFINSLSMIIKNYIKYNNVRDYKLKELYKNIFNIVNGYIN